jgi:hypothetical protein
VATELLHGNGASVRDCSIWVAMGIWSSNLHGGQNQFQLPEQPGIGRHGLRINYRPKMNSNRPAWFGEIGCEGGPVIVANLEDFLQWRGSEPFSPSSATELHYWSSFTAELPQQWQPNGPSGHQYLLCANPIRARESLISLLIERWPGTKVDRGNSTWQAVRPDGRVLNVALSPDSEYDRAVRDLGTDGVHIYSRGASGYLWSAGPGMVRIDIDETRRCLLLSQVEYAADEADAQVAYAHALSAPYDHVQPSQQYKITEGPIVVAWAPNSARDWSTSRSSIETTCALPGKLLDLSTDGSGALLLLEPGVYQSTLHYHEEGSWAVSWCQLQRLDP